MAFLENKIFCSLEEYQRDMERRVDVHDLRENDLYALVMKLDSDKREAAKLAVRLLAKQDDLVKIMFLDGDLNPTDPIVAVEDRMANGFVHNFARTCVIDSATNERIAIKQAFFKDYFEDQFGGVLDTAITMSA